jgi:hypothetical protein
MNKIAILIQLLLLLQITSWSADDSLENIEGLENSKNLLTSSIAVGICGILLWGGGQYAVSWSEKHYGSAHDWAEEKPGTYPPGYVPGNAMVFISFPVIITSSSLAIIGLIKHHKYSKRLIKAK